MKVPQGLEREIPLLGKARTAGSTVLTETCPRVETEVGLGNRRASSSIDELQLIQH